MGNRTKIIMKCENSNNKTMNVNSVWQHNYNEREGTGFSIQQQNTDIRIFCE